MSQNNPELNKRQQKTNDDDVQTEAQKTGGNPVSTQMCATICKVQWGNGERSTRIDTVCQ